MTKKKLYIDLNNGEKIRMVAKEIILLEVTPDDTFISVLNKFYRIMRKYKIKQLHSEDGGKTFRGNCFEYTMCKQLFLKRIEDIFGLAEWGTGIFKNNPIPKSVER